MHSLIPDQDEGSFLKQLYDFLSLSNIEKKSEYRGQFPLRDGVEGTK